MVVLFLSFPPIPSNYSAHRIRYHTQLCVRQTRAPILSMHSVNDLCRGLATFTITIRIATCIHSADTLRPLPYLSAVLSRMSSRRRSLTLSKWCADECKLVG